jgi:hypothetical protein
MLPFGKEPSYPFLLILIIMFIVERYLRAYEAKKLRSVEKKERVPN